MKLTQLKTVAVAGVLAALYAMPAAAQIKITEVSAFSSGATPNNGYSSDWFELTNFGAAAVNISGWKMDDDSVSFAAGALLTGVTSIAPGESVLFVNNAVNNAFKTAWFGASTPLGLQIGNYVGGPGLGQGGDTVAVFDSGQALQARVDFGASGGNLEGVGNSPFHTFDNAAALNNTTISTLSAVGVNGAFLSANGVEIGSPGTITAVPEPETYAMMLAGFAGILSIARRRNRS